MPTGYTHAIKDGITFPQFALNCARAFGALIEMRDDPADAPIPEQFKPSTYNQEAAAKAVEEIKRLQSMTSEECEKAAQAHYSERLQYHEKAIMDAADLENKYQDMLTKAELWLPPTSEHDGLKKFMCEQITESIRFDCGGTYHQDAIKELKAQTGEEWRAYRIEEEQQSYSRNTTAQLEENERTEKRNSWIASLRQSLPA